MHLCFFPKVAGNCVPRTRTLALCWLYCPADCIQTRSLTWKSIKILIFEDPDSDWSYLFVYSLSPLLASTTFLAAAAQDNAFDGTRECGCHKIRAFNISGFHSWHKWDQKSSGNQYFCWDHLWSQTLTWWICLLLSVLFLVIWRIKKITAWAPDSSPSCPRAPKPLLIASSLLFIPCKFEQSIADSNQRTLLDWKVF